jgi:hypothetical protein
MGQVGPGRDLDAVGPDRGEARAEPLAFGHHRERFGHHVEVPFAVLAGRGGDGLAQREGDLDVAFRFGEHVDLEREAIGAAGQKVGLLAAQPVADHEEQRRRIAHIAADQHDLVVFPGKAALGAEARDNLALFHPHGQTVGVAGEVRHQPGEGRAQGSRFLHRAGSLLSGAWGRRRAR